MGKAMFLLIFFPIPLYIPNPSPTTKSKKRDVLTSNLPTFYFETRFYYMKLYFESGAHVTGLVDQRLMEQDEIKNLTIVMIKKSKKTRRKNQIFKSLKLFKNASLSIRISISSAFCLAFSQSIIRGNLSVGSTITFPGKSP